MAEALSKELIERASAGRHQEVDRLLKEGADADWADHNGYTALSEAAMAGHTVVVGQLLRAGAEPNVAAADGRTALHRAAFFGWLPIVRLLLQHGADPELEDAEGRRPRDLSKKDSVSEALTAGAEEHQELIAEKRRTRPAREAKPEIVYPPKREGPVTRRFEAKPEKEGEDQKDRERNGEKKDEKFLELHSSLDIVARPDDYAARAGQGYVSEVRLQQGSLIVETSDGLFTSEEVKQEEESPEQQAEAWLQVAEGSYSDLEALLAAKAEAQQLFNAGKVGEARQITTAAIRSAAILLARDSELESEDLRNLFGVLHSNRSLLLTTQIQAQDQELLQFGSHAAWSLVVKDSDVALRQNPSNFKASFRRAKALYELGDLEQALLDVTKVVDHYARNTQVSNPEAVELRQNIQQQLKKERAKWGEKGGPRWNRAANSLISELDSEYAAA